MLFIADNQTTDLTTKGETKANPPTANEGDDSKANEKK